MLFAEVIGFGCVLCQIDQLWFSFHYVVFLLRSPPLLQSSWTWFCADLPRSKGRWPSSSEGCSAVKNDNDVGHLSGVSEGNPTFAAKMTSRMATNELSDRGTVDWGAGFNVHV